MIVHEFYIYCSKYSLLNKKMKNLSTERSLRHSRKNQPVSVSLNFETFTTASEFLLMFYSSSNFELFNESDFYQISELFVSVKTASKYDKTGPTSTSPFKLSFYSNI